MALASSYLLCVRNAGIEPDNEKSQFSAVLLSASRFEVRQRPPKAKKDKFF